MNIRKLLLTALLFVPALLFAAQSWAATYTVTAGTSQQASSGTVSLAPPGGSDQADKILIIIAGSSSTGATVSTSPSGYTRVDALGELAMFYKLGTGSEGSVNVGFSSGAIAAQIYSIESSTGGWDASPLAGFATRSPAAGADIPYSAMTAVSNGNLRFRVGVKRGNQTGITVSSVALTSGYTSGGFVSRDGLVGGLVLAAEWQEVAGNATDDDAVITTWSTVLNRDGITAEFIPASSAPTVTLSDATPDIDTTVTATLSGAFGAGGNPTTATLSSGDTVACSSATSTTCTFTPAWSDLQPAAGTTFDFADRDLGDLQPNFARTGAQTGVAVDGTLETIADGLPAFDGPRGWLAEESRTNTALYSRDVNIAAWVHNGVDVVGGQADPFGGTSAVRLTENTDTFGPRRVYQWQAVGQAGAAYTSTFYAKYVDCPWVFVRDNISGATLRAWFNIQTGTVGTVNGGLTATITPVVDGWYRLSITSTADGTAQALSLFGMASADGVADHTEIGRSVLVAGAQHEKGAFATSPIHTEGATATRQPTSLSGIPASVFAPGAGAITNDVATIFSVRPAFPSSATRSSAARLLVLQGDSSNLIDVYTLTTGNTINFRRRAGGADVETATVTVTPGWAAGDELLVAARYTSSGVEARVLHNGVWYTGTTAVGTALSTALANAYVGVDASAANHMTGVFGGLQIWTGADVPSDAELAALTADDLTEALNGTGELAKTQLQTGYTVTLTNGTETSQSTAINIQIPASGYAIVDLTCTAGTDCSDDSEAIVPMIAGDDCAIKVNTGSLNHLSTECAPVFNGGAFSYTVARYDESATAWLAQEEVSVTPPTSCRGIVGDIVFDIVQDILKEMQCVD